jgi:hypothetical protein
LIYFGKVFFGAVEGTTTYKIFAICYVAISLITMWHEDLLTLVKVQAVNTIFVVGMWILLGADMWEFVVTYSVSAAICIVAFLGFLFGSDTECTCKQE